MSLSPPPPDAISRDSKETWEKILKAIPTETKISGILAGSQKSKG